MLANLLKDYMINEKLSVKDVAKRIDVNPSVIQCVINNQPIDIDGLLKITDLIGVEIDEILDIKEDEDEILKQIIMIISVDPNLSVIFGDIARGVRKSVYEKRVLAEVAAYVTYRLNLENDVADR